MAERKSYRLTANSICEGQLLSFPYEYQKAKIIIQEMAGNLTYQLYNKGMGTDFLTMDMGYDRENCDTGSYYGERQIIMGARFQKALMVPSE